MPDPPLELYRVSNIVYAIIKVVDLAVFNTFS